MVNEDHVIDGSEAANHGLQVTVLVLDALFFALATAAIGIRLWSRRIQRHRLCLNDYAILLAWV